VSDSGVLMRHSPQDSIQNLIEILTNVFGQEPEDQIAVLLKQSILATIAPVGLRVAQMLAAIQFDGEARGRAKQSTSMRPQPSKGIGRPTFKRNFPAVSVRVSSRRYRNASLALRARGGCRDHARPI